MGRAVARLVDRLLQLPSGDGFQVYYRADDPPTDPEVPSVAAWRERGLARAQRLISGEVLSTVTRRDGLEILHLWDYFYPIYTVEEVTGGAFRPARIILTVHDLIPLRFPEHHGFGHRSLLDHLIPILGTVDRIVVNARTTRRELVDRHGVREDRIEVIPLGVDRSRFHTDHPEEAVARVRRRYRLPDRYLLYVSGVDWRKNHPLLVEAFARFWRRAGGDWGLVLAGPDTARLEPLISGTPWADAVRLLGSVPEGDIPLLYAGATLFLFPSRDEGFGLPLLEAMASGVPVLAAAAGAIPEVAGDAALLLEPRDADVWAEAMLRLTRDEEQCRAMRRKGLFRAAGLTWEQAARRYLDLYHRLVLEDA